MNHAAARYLESKRSVDDRARSRRVRDRLLDALPAEPRVFEAGCGTGATVPKLHEWGVGATYRGVDRDAGVVAFAREVRPRAFRRAGRAVTDTDDGFAVGDLTAGFAVGDALSAARAEDGAADLFVAQAFADLVELPELVDAAEAALAPGGLAYFPITFDGGTVFQPDHPADDAVEAAYHATIDDRPGRDVRAGRHLADLLRRRDGDLLAVDGSDWVVRPRESEYPADEAYFLKRILGFVEGALLGGDGSLDASGRTEADIEAWLATRREQVAAAELTYVAHQYDLLYRAPR